MENLQSTTIDISTYIYIACIFFLLMIILVKRKSIKEFLDELPKSLMISMILAFPIIIIIFVIISMIF